MSLAIVPLFLAGYLPAAGAAGSADETAQFVSAVNAVEVYASITDAKGEPVTGLAAAAGGGRSMMMGGH